MAYWKNCVDTKNQTSGGLEELSPCNMLEYIVQNYDWSCSQEYEGTYDRK